jgi:hypothetical protein
MTDYRAELQRLVKAYDEHGGRWPDHHEQALSDAVEAARATLAQPEPEGLTDQDLDDLANEMLDWNCEGWRAYARAVIAADRARFGRPTTEPVPVAERLPGAEDCDAEGRCWAWGDAYPWLDWKCWKLFPFRYVAVPPDVTHWLPHHALPVPGAEVQS